MQECTSSRPHPTTNHKPLTANDYRMQECTSSRPHPTTNHKPLTANDIHNNNTIGAARKPRTRAYLANAQAASCTDSITNERGKLSTSSKMPKTKARFRTQKATANRWKPYSTPGEVERLTGKLAFHKILSNTNNFNYETTNNIMV